MDCPVARRLPSGSPGRRLAHDNRSRLEWPIGSQAMTLSAGMRLGPYEILSPLGAGGMGEVYRARDTRLDRSVAVKVLPPHQSSSPEARERFEREAKTISQLSHPNICALFDVGRQDETDFLVMELLEGETLSDRLKKGPLPLEQTLRCGVEIADALDQAHRQGIVHRDLKPGNVMLTKAGVKLLDFGLAKAIAPLLRGADASQLETATAPHDLTQEGTLLGTFPYMAPEQIEGKAADTRTDIFALGAVLYEMATGKRAFVGDTRAALASAILTSEPKPMPSLRPTCPPALDRLVRTCLAKDPERRWQTAHDVGLQLAALAEDGPLGPAPSASSVGRRLVPWVVAALGVAVGLGALLRPQASPPAVPRTVRFSVPPPPGRTFLDTVETVPLALSPDGSQLAFVARDPTGVTRLWLRPLSAMEARPLEGTEGALSSLWSPDGRSLAFFAAGKLKRLDLPGGSALPLCDVRPGVGLHGTWGRDGQILFASAEGEAIYRVSTAGGAPAVAVKADPSQGDTRINWPSFLPDGQRFFYLTRLRDGGGQLMLAQPGKPPRPVLPGVSSVQYVDPGYLVFAREGTLLGQRFDFANGRVAGEPFSIARSGAVLRLFGVGGVHGLAERRACLRVQQRSGAARLDRPFRPGARECRGPGGQPPGEDLARRAEGPLRPEATGTGLARPVDGGPRPRDRDTADLRPAKRGCGRLASRPERRDLHRRPRGSAALVPQGPRDRRGRGAASCRPAPVRARRVT